MAMLTNEIDATLETVKELLRGLPQVQKERAKHAAVALEATFQKLRHDHPNDPATALGAVFAIFTLADRLVNIERDCETKGQGMIQLLG